MYAELVDDMELFGLWIIGHDFWVWTEARENRNYYTGAWAVAKDVCVLASTREEYIEPWTGQCGIFRPDAAFLCEPFCCGRAGIIFDCVGIYRAFTREIVKKK